jgi:hypothetical protein
MDILDRYLQAIGEYLPAAGKEDTLAELRANLLALIEDREEQLGRPLNEDELVEIIRNHGRPVVVASRYLPQQWLIGPELFPFYRLALRRSLPLVILFYFSAQAVSLLFHDHGRVDIGAAIGAAMVHLPGTLFVFWGVMTVVFVGIEWACRQYGTSLSQPWNPRELPRMEKNQGKAPSLTGGIVDLIVSTAMLFWLLAIPTRPFLILGPGVDYLKNQQIGFTPQWHTFYWQIIGLLAAQLVLKAVMVGIRRFSTWRKVLDLIVHALGLGILAVMVRAQIYFVPVQGFAPIQHATLAAINQSIYLGFRIALLIATLKLLWDVVVFVRDTWAGLRATSRVVV